MITEKTSVYFYRAQLCEIWFMILLGVYCEICEHNDSYDFKGTCMVKTKDDTHSLN